MVQGFKQLETIGGKLSTHDHVSFPSQTLAAMTPSTSSTVRVSLFHPTVFPAAMKKAPVGTRRSILASLDSSEQWVEIPRQYM